MKTEKKGFTLIELLGVIVLIAIIAVIAFVVIDRTLKERKQQMLEVQFDNIELAAKNWGIDHVYSLPTEGKEISIYLATLKMGGYAEQDIVNPITKQSFSNCTIVVVKHDGNTNKYNYTVDRDSINNMDGACDPSFDIENEPTISISGGDNTLGYGQTTTFTLTYNYQNLDKSKISLKEEDIILSTNSESISSSEMTIGKEFYNSTNEIYEMIITLKAGNYEEARTWIEVEEGAIIHNDKKSPFVSSPVVIIDNKAPSKDVPLIDQEAIVGSECNDIDGEITFCKSLVSSSDISNKNYCMDNINYNFGELNNSYKTLIKAYQFINLKIKDSNDIYYRVYTKSNDEKLYMDPWSIYVDDVDENGIYDIDYKTVVNNEYYFEICDVNGNCMDDYGPVKLSYNDCAYPVISITDQLGQPAFYTRTEEVFIDMDDYRPAIDDSIDSINRKFSSYSGVRNISIKVSSLSEINDDFKEVLEIYPSNLVSMNGKELYNIFQNGVHYIGKNYFFVTLTDKAGNTKMFPLYDVMVEIDNNDNVLINNSDSVFNGDDCDTICKMRKNSILWHSCETDSCKVQLHQQNLEYCESLRSSGKECQYESLSGKYYVVATLGELFPDSKELYNIYVPTLSEVYTSTD